MNFLRLEFALRRFCHLRFAALALLSVHLAANATSYVPMTDDDLLMQADRVIVGSIETIEDLHGTARARTLYSVTVERVLKGGLRNTAAVTVEIPGNRDLRRGGVQVIAAPRFSRGERVILFLNDRPGGGFAVTQLMLGAFVQRDIGASAVALRDLSQARSLGAGADAASELNRVRDFSRFVDWLQRRAQSVGRPAAKLPGAATADYWIAMAEAAKRRSLPRFELPDDLARWIEFDSDTEVPWYAAESGQTGMPGLGFQELQNAIAVWNDDAGSNILLRYAGTTTVQTPADGDNLVLFDDPGDIIAGSFNGTGTLAINSLSMSDTTHNHNGNAFFRIIKNTVTTQDGVGSYFSGNDGNDGEEVLAHEIGHALGLAHSCGDKSPCDTSVKQDALMRSFAHGGGRGARLGLDDSAAVAVLYAQPGISLQAPTDVSATDGAFRDRIGVSWTGVSGAAGYQIWRNTNTSVGSATLIASGVIDNEYVDTDIIPDTDYFYWVKAENGANTSDFSNADVGSAASNPVCPTPATVTLLNPEPEGRPSGRFPVFSWSPLTDVSGYQIDLSKLPDFTSSFRPELDASTTRYTAPVPVSVGVHYWRVRGVNKAGACDLEGPWSEVRAYYIDNALPSLTIQQPASDTSVPMTQDAIEVSGLASDPDGNITAVRYRLNGASWTTQTATEVWMVSVADLALGDNQVELQAKDNDNDLGGIVERIVKRTPPGAQPQVVISDPAASVVVRPLGTVSHDFSGTASDADGAIERVEYRINRDVWKRASGENAWNFVADPLQAGTNLVEVRATDDDGVLSPLARRTIAIRESGGTVFGDDFE